MSKQTISLVSDTELLCYVCKRVIHDLKRVRTLARFKNDDRYFSVEGIKKRNKCNEKVIEITGSLDTKRTFRHSRCNPVEKQI